MAYGFGLRISEDGRLEEKEFDIIPSRGTLEPSEKQLIRVGLFVIGKKSIAWCLPCRLTSSLEM